MATKKKKRTRSAIGRQNRARGGAYERWVAKQLAEVFPGARRGIGQARSGGDVPDVEGCEQWWVQCKNEKAPNLFKALGQAAAEVYTRGLQSHAPNHCTTPLVIARRTGTSEDVVAMSLDDFLALLRASRADRAVAEMLSARCTELTKRLNVFDPSAAAGTNSFKPESET